MAPWVPAPSWYDADDEDDVCFVLNNDVDHVQVLRPLQGHGFRVIALPENLRQRPDEEVRAWVRDRGCMLITHDQDDAYKKSFDPATNPGVIIIPKDARGRVDFPLVGAVFNNIRSAVDAYRETVIEVSPGGRITIWNPDLDTGNIYPASMRLAEDNSLEVWEDDQGNYAVAPDYAWDLTSGD